MLEVVVVHVAVKIIHLSYLRENKMNSSRSLQNTANALDWASVVNTKVHLQVELHNPMHLSASVR